MRLHLIHCRRPAAVSEERRNGHGAVHSPWGDHLAIDQMVHQPGGIGGKHLRLEHYVAARRFMLGAKQLMAGSFLLTAF